LMINNHQPLNTLSMIVGTQICTLSHRFNKFTTKFAYPTL
jgi:hypothetical protein